ncbi:hypothetical protein BJ508DRAFT_48262 [Ascobolus immersus RN42]|uniref:Uncharacterized protein n=1 Tax=Ascobolus immersus RN42 TaxID=1160509 RepID=A0A3N4HVC5_ASCIM|nr:hypothetical protein BJ508DRAFT_48262 [Ascobolus immersus RN42]
MERKIVNRSEEDWRQAAFVVQQSMVSRVQDTTLDVFSLDPGRELLKLVVTEAGGSDTLNICLLRLAKSVLKEKQENPYQFPIRWSGYSEDVESILRVTVMRHGLAFSAVLGYAPFYCSLGVLVKTITENMLFTHTPHEGQLLLAHPLGPDGSYFRFMSSWLPQELPSRAPIIEQVQKARLAREYSHRNQLDIATRHLDFGFDNCYNSTLVVYSDEHSLRQNHGFPSSVFHKHQSLSEMLGSVTEAANLALLDATIALAKGKEELSKLSILVTANVSRRAGRRYEQELYHGRSIGRIGRQERGTFGLFLGTEEQIRASGLRFVLPTVTQHQTQPPIEKTNDQAQPAMDAPTRLMSFIPTASSLSTPENASAVPFLTAGHVAPAACELQAPGGFETALELKSQWIRKADSFRSEAEVSRILAQVTRIGTSLESRIGTSSRGYRKDWSLCVSTVEKCANNGFEGEPADRIMNALVDNPDFSEAELLETLSGSEDALPGDRVAKDGATTAITSGRMNGDTLQVWKYLENSTEPTQRTLALPIVSIR